MKVNDFDVSSDLYAISIFTNTLSFISLEFLPYITLYLSPIYNQVSLGKEIFDIMSMPIDTNLSNSVYPTVSIVAFLKIQYFGLVHKIIFQDSKYAVNRRPYTGKTYFL